SGAVVSHKWGRTRLSGDPRIHILPVKLPTVRQQFEQQKKETMSDPNPEKLLKLAEWALTHGLLNDFNAVMDDLAKKDAKTFSSRVREAVQAYTQVEGAMNRPITKPDDGQRWRGILRYKGVTYKPHYALVHDATDTAIEVQSRLAKLEQIYRTFYYWFAIKGHALPVPDHRLVVILANTDKEFEQQHAMFDNLPLVSDGFYARRDNLAVLASRRLDEPYEALSKFTQANLWSNGWDMQSLLNNRPGLKTRASPEDFYHAQTLALIQKAQLEEAELAAISHEGTRQLVAASGLLPRNVNAPEWIQFGMASLFETSKGALWSSPGGPSWAYLVQYKDYEQSKEQNKRLEAPNVAVEKVITDEYFHQVRAGADREARMRARTLAWAFTFYLCQQRVDGLIRYYQELQNMPRDLEFDKDALLGAFARAFDFTDPLKPGGIDRAALMSIGRDWYDTMNLWKLPVPAEAGNALQTYARIQAGATIKKDKDAPKDLNRGPRGGGAGAGSAAGGRPGGGQPGGGGGRRGGGGKRGGGQGQPNRPGN